MSLVNYMSAVFRTIVKMLFVEVLFISLIVSGCIFNRSLSLADKAKELADGGDYDGAIATYTRHIEERLENPNRDINENPFFYFLLIGDIYLAKKDYKAAESSYSLALMRSVNKELVADRIYTLSKAIINQNNLNTKDLNTAWDLLGRYREIDPLMFDYYLSELHRTMIEKADSVAEPTH